MAKFICDIPLRVGQGLLFGSAPLPPPLPLPLLHPTAQSALHPPPHASAAHRPAPAPAPACSAILYWIVGLNPSASAFFVFCCIVICEGLAAQGLGVAISAGG